MQGDPVVQMAGALSTLRELSDPGARAEAERIAVTLASGERLAPDLRARATALDAATRAVCGDTLPSAVPEHHPLWEALQARVFNHVDGVATSQCGTVDTDAARRAVAACAAVPGACSDFVAASYMLGSEQATRGGEWVAALAAEIVDLREQVARMREGSVAAVRQAAPSPSSAARAAPLPCWNAPVTGENPWD